MAITVYIYFLLYLHCIVIQAASCLPTLVEHMRNHNSHGKIIVSCYVDGTTPPHEVLLQLVELMQATGADIIKLVTLAADITEIKRIFSLFLYCQAWLFFFFPFSSLHLLNNHISNINCTIAIIIQAQVIAKRGNLVFLGLIQ